MPAGTVMTVSFELEGQSFTALNGGPHLTFSPAISFVVNCETQEEVNYYWNKLSEGGDPKAQHCGWLADKFGLSWQIVPAELRRLLGDHDPEKGGRVMNAMLKMKKIVIDGLRKRITEHRHAPFNSTYGRRRFIWRGAPLRAY